jgi:hydrogenase maturation protease
LTPSPDGTDAARQILVGGVGLPWLRDLDFGTQFVRRVSDLDWPDHVVVEDLSYAAHRVLHLLQELRPVKVVLVGAMPRDVDPPGTIRRYKLDLTPPPDQEVVDRLGEAVGGIIDLDHTLAVIRYWKALPEDTVVIEVEPADRSFGLGFSTEVEASVEPILAMVREEVGSVAEEVTT